MKDPRTATQGLVNTVVTNLEESKRFNLADVIIDVSFVSFVLYIGVKLALSFMASHP